MSDAETDTTEWIVLVNDEEQHSLWPAPNPVPAGWRSVTAPGTHEACVAYVEANWTDMRPLSLRSPAPGPG